MEEFTRLKLIDICEKAIVQESEWHNRDSPNCQMKVGECWALLKAGCRFEIRTAENHTNCVTDDRTIWLNIWHNTFNSFEDGSGPENELYYLPTEERLADREGGDWY